ncbi:uncharacterized protein LOC121142646 isoform X2 [Mesocricetus auratus]|uniref:Uncharacterized protein LOC121142646 isoform X2 n=1 Tax=Mesocricetus auratus TaxID=10036 RepID=A0ABM2Y408_MESAU|nr:uncharacterized protein LOC121142646 isoform X2 [Mesocricetus auratus]
MAGAGSNGEALAPRMELIEMKDKLRNRQEIVNGLNIFLEENEEDASLEELEEESDVFEEEETEALSEDGSKEAHDNVRTSHKVSLRSITSMTDEERFNMRIKKFGINTSKEFRKSPGASCFGLTMSTGKENADMNTTLMHYINDLVLIGPSEYKAFCRLCHHSIASDQGTHFTGRKVHQWTHSYRIRWSYHVPQHAEASGLIERKRREGDWSVSDSCDLLLHLLSRVYMSKVNRRTKLKFSPSVYHQFFNLFIDVGLYL